jgi:hypothetical protein
MTRFSRTATTSFLIGLSLAISHPALAADGSRSTALNDAQLDGIVAGSKATAKGDAQALGETARSGAAASSQIGGGGVTGIAAGSASASADGASAVASSTLFLSITIR